MTLPEAMKVLERAGITGRDAETALAAALKGHDIDEVLDEARHFNNQGLMRWFGQDGGRAMIVLLKERARV